MDLRDLLSADDDEQRARVDGPSIREVAARQEEQLFHGQDAERHPWLPDEFDPGFWSHLPGDEKDHPDQSAINPYLFVPGSELEFLLKHKRDLSPESRKRISDALLILGWS